MRVKRIICPVCESERRIILDEDNTREYSEEIISKTCEKPECQNNPENRLLEALFGGVRALVCGDRHWTDKEFIMAVLAKVDNLRVVIEGEAKGADTLAREVAEEYGIPFLPFPAEWNKYGRAAGPIRNTQMLNEGKPNLVLAFHDNIIESKGTKDMVEQARSRGIEVRMYSHRHSWR